MDLCDTLTVSFGHNWLQLVIFFETRFLAVKPLDQLRLCLIFALVTFAPLSQRLPGKWPYTWVSSSQSSHTHDISRCPAMNTSTKLRQVSLQRASTTNYPRLHLSDRQPIPWHSESCCQKRQTKSCGNKSANLSTMCTCLSCTTCDILVLRDQKSTGRTSFWYRNAF